MCFVSEEFSWMATIYAPPAGGIRPPDMIAENQGECEIQMLPEELVSKPTRRAVIETRWKRAIYAIRDKYLEETLVSFCRAIR